MKNFLTCTILSLSLTACGMYPDEPKSKDEIRKEHEEKIKNQAIQDAKDKSSDYLLLDLSNEKNACEKSISFSNGKRVKVNSCYLTNEVLSLSVLGEVSQKTFEVDLDTTRTARELMQKALSFREEDENVSVYLATVVLAITSSKEKSL